MGDTASNMKKSDGSAPGREENDKAIDGLFGLFHRRKDKKKNISNPRTFADLIDKADQELEEIIQKRQTSIKEFSSLIEQANESLEALTKNKQKEYETEVNDKAYNKKALNSLSLMAVYLERITDELLIDPDLILRETWAEEIPTLWLPLRINLDRLIEEIIEYTKLRGK